MHYAHQSIASQVYTSVMIHLDVLKYAMKLGDNK